VVVNRVVNKSIGFIVDEDNSDSRVVSIHLLDADRVSVLVDGMPILQEEEDDLSRRCPKDKEVRC